ncbi:MAG: hypothetical protein ACK5N7_10445 [Curvibacter sp.]|jgi:hypothetical protein|nr:hypothetical protein [Curvibacter sp.]
MALGIASPWHVGATRFDAAARTLTIREVLEGPALVAIHTVIFLIAGKLDLRVVNPHVSQPT